MVEWYCAPGGRQIGPFGEDQLREMIRVGQVSPQDAVWRQGMTDWVPAATVPQLFPVPGAPMAMPLPAQAQPGAGGPLPVMTLSYATPAAAALAPAPFSAPEYDPGPFTKLGGTFTVKGSRWSGPAVASPIAIYLLKVAQQNSGVYGGGLVGYMVATALTKNDDTRSCDLFQLPEPVRTALDPKSKRKRGGDVIILRRDATSLIKLGRINNTLLIRLGPDRFGVVVGLFSKGRIRQFLTGNGWTLNAELMPTAAPTHGSGYGRPDGVPPPGMGIVKRVLLIVLAIIIFVAVVALRVGCDHSRY
jgi:hypothetical protein